MGTLAQTKHNHSPSFLDSLDSGCSCTLWITPMVCVHGELLDDVRDDCIKEPVLHWVTYIHSETLGHPCAAMPICLLKVPPGHTTLLPCPSYIFTPTASSGNRTVSHLPIQPNTLPFFFRKRIFEPESCEAPPPTWSHLPGGKHGGHVLTSHAVTTRSKSAR